MGISGCFYSGAIAGACQSFVLTPVELVKTQLQVRKGKTKVKEMQFAYQLYNKFGWRSCYRGFTATLCRDAPACGMYFAGNTGILTLLAFSPADSSGKQLTKLMTAGGMAGVLSWMISYPLDVLKSKIQAENLNQCSYKGIVDCYKKTILKDGQRVLYAGISPALIRAFVSNGALFTVHAMCLSLLNQ